MGRRLETEQFNPDRPQPEQLHPYRPQPEQYGPDRPQGYALSGKIMLSAIVILFFVVILMVCLHLYARWYLHRARRRHLRRNHRNRRTHIVFHEDAATLSAAPTRGLDASVLNSLPVFVYSSKSDQTALFQQQPILECAVCLSEFEDNETGRLLPKCKHSFHIECIDMWFHSHSTCPLCRAPVEPSPESETQPDVVLSVCEPDGGEPGPSSDWCSECCNSETTSSGAWRKPSNIVVPRRNESFGRGEDSGLGESPAGQSFRSPMSRMLSFRRILSREKRNGGVSPSGVNAGSCSSVAESDIELGGRQGTTECTRRE
ncbi:hypothetical protein C1H46_022566 [Malus baccata]|uniref:RING-type E3 ubiquitin transferase n=1 Tax=Malus baccata TaxID=106549 RepID=A0A540LZL7_MALBA|nr:hypothetical protein C1H46_022566 [Malus baccata]